MEIWVDIKGFDGKYQVSNYGNARAAKFRTGGRGHELIQPKNLELIKKDGSDEYHVRLRHELHSLNKLVFENFVGKPRTPVKYEYIDGNKTNNKLCNLKLTPIKG